jgi:hypothetical protein
MILYTMMPNELIFPYEKDGYQKQIKITYNGVPLLVEPADPQTYQVVRVLSSDPQHFLDDRICPGAKISLINQEGLSSI